MSKKVLLQIEFKVILTALKLSSISSSGGLFIFIYYLKINNKKINFIFLFMLKINIMYDIKSRQIVLNVYFKLKSLRKTEYITNISRSTISRWNAKINIKQKNKISDNRI